MNLWWIRDFYLCCSWSEHINSKTLTRLLFFFPSIHFVWNVRSCMRIWLWIYATKQNTYAQLHTRRIGLAWLGSTRRVRTERKGKCLLWNKNKLKLILFLFEAYTQFVSFVFYLNDIHVFVNQNGANRSFILLDSFYVFVFFIVSFKRIVFISCKLYIKYHGIGISRV